MKKLLGYLGFIVSSATALVKFLCDIGKNLRAKTNKPGHSMQQSMLLNKPRSQKLCEPRNTHLK